MSTCIVSKMECGVVVIGRNEGDRLRVCIDSVLSAAAVVVYVDSGSTDGSVAMAREKGIEIVELDMSVPFTAARARNAGWRRLREIAPTVPYVQFVDGDCEVVPGWITKAVEFLHSNSDVVVVCGRRRERYPERSIFNQLCDIEWDAPAGLARSCGGDSMMRIAALEAAGGFRQELIAGEEPELCVRLRAGGGKIWRLADEMTLHDAAMTRFGQWWSRTRRAGYAFAWGAWLHGAAPERHCVAQARRALLWGIIFPLGIFFLAIFNPLALIMLLAYPAQVLRLAVRDTSHSPRVKWQRAFFLVLGRLPEGLGMLGFIADKIAGKRSVLIEYK